MVRWAGYVKRQHGHRKIAIRGTRPKHTDDETRIINASRTRGAIQRIRKAFLAGNFFCALAALISFDIESNKRSAQIVAANDVATPVHTVHLMAQRENRRDE